MREVSPTHQTPLDALPLITTTNTFMEAAMEDELLTEIQSSSGEKQYKWTAEVPVRANPFVSLEMMQSGTLGEICTSQMLLQGCLIWSGFK